MSSLAQEKRPLLRMIYPADDGWPFWIAKGVRLILSAWTEQLWCYPGGLGAKGGSSTARRKLNELRPSWFLSPVIIFIISSLYPKSKEGLSIEWLIYSIQADVDSGEVIVRAYLIGPWPLKAPIVEKLQHPFNNERFYESLLIRVKGYTVYGKWLSFQKLFNSLHVYNLEMLLDFLASL